MSAQSAPTSPRRLRVSLVTAHAQRLNFFPNKIVPARIRTRALVLSSTSLYHYAMFRFVSRFEKNCIYFLIETHSLSLLCLIPSVSIHPPASLPAATLPAAVAWACRSSAGAPPPAPLLRLRRPSLLPLLRQLEATGHRRPARPVRHPQLHCCVSGARPYFHCCGSSRQPDTGAQPGRRHPETSAPCPAGAPRGTSLAGSRHPFVHTWTPQSSPLLTEGKSHICSILILGFVECIAFEFVQTC
jgi:hypothetical protein